MVADDLAGDYKSIFDRLRNACRRTGMPRTLNFITGLSRSGNIEQTLVLGAHGPRWLQS